MDQHKAKFMNIPEISGRKDYGCYFGYESKRYWFTLSAALGNADNNHHAFEQKQKYNNQFKLLMVGKSLRSSSCRTIYDFCRHLNKVIQ